MPDNKAHSHKVDIQMHKKEPENEIRILLLGGGESGKSTIAKQMKIVNVGAFSEDEKLSYKTVIYTNIMISLKSFKDAMIKTKLKFEDDYNVKTLQNSINLVQKTKSENGDFASLLTSSLGVDLNRLWKDPAVEIILSQTSEFYLPDSFAYFMTNIERISNIDYSPTDQDILRSRVKTTGILETKFIADRLNITLIDVGGQRNERRKWIHCFENVTSLMFVVGLTEYNQMLLEDPNVNRLQESIQMFDSIINSRWFLRSTIIFLLNKTDLFKDRLRRFPLENYYKEYICGYDPSKAAKYIYMLFQDVNRQKLKLYPHYTNATDTKAMKSVFNAINDTYAHNYLKGNGLL